MMAARKLPPQDPVTGRFVSASTVAARQDEAPAPEVEPATYTPAPTPQPYQPSHALPEAAPSLRADALNRALRTAWQAVGTLVVLAILTAAKDAFTGATSWREIDWGKLSYAAAQGVVMVLASWWMRRYGDGSAIPTPLPPATPEPRDDDPDAL